jgi:hypothetical protein
MEINTMLVRLFIEREARADLLEGLQKTSCLRDLQAALSEKDTDAVELDFSKLVDIELTAAAGLFNSLCQTIDVGRFPKTFQFCFFLFAKLSAEFNRRRGSIDAK